MRLVHPPRIRAACALLVVLGLLGSSCGRLEPLSTEEALERLNVATTKVLDADGNVIANLHGEINREIVKLVDIPLHVRQAVVAIEDERFWSHQGIDLRSIVRAATANARRGESGGVQGGSTISQQLAKSLYFPQPARTIGRKITEARITVQLERQYSKNEVLEMYLNTIYLGRGAYGVEAAARSYFGKRAAELNLHEGAFLAGLIHEPARYEWSPSDPVERQQERREAGRTRRNIVLARMETLGFIEGGERQRAQDEPLQVRAYEPPRWKHPYFVDHVLRTLGVLGDRLDLRFEFLGADANERSTRVYRGGLRIYTALDPRAQEAAEESIPEVLADAPDKLSAALVAIEPRTGFVRALVGGRDYYPECEDLDDGEPSRACSLAKVNLALGAEGGGSGRQPGSSFKPFVLTAALQRGISLHESYNGSPFTYSYPGGTWKVGNYDGGGGGQPTLIAATARSINAAYARLEIEGVGDGDGLKGAERVALVARRLGIAFPTRDELKARCGDDYVKTDRCLPADDTPAIALGAKEVSPFEMATAYATFANDGKRVEPNAIVRITDGTGKVLWEAEPEQRQVIPAGIARGVTHVLQKVVTGGTGTRAAIGRPAAAKTGTSQSWRDAWLAGYVPQLAAVVWVGNPIPIPGEGVESMIPSNGYPVRVVGGTLPAMIWKSFMTGALRGVPEREFSDPPQALFHPPSAPPPQPSVSPGPGDDFTGVVPAVTGELFGIARSRVSRAGYSVAALGQCGPDPDLRLHRVWAQEPAGGTAAPAGSAVTIWYQPGAC